jgi:hypothetical protein
MAVLLLGISSFLAGQIPVSCTLQPITPGGFGGYCATRIILLHDGFPIDWYIQLGLIIIAFRYRRELANELRQSRQQEA